MLDQARALDAADPLREYRSRFELPEGVIYLDGNSLGALPKATKARLSHVVQREWGSDLIRSWNATENGGDWITAPQRIGAKIAPLVGAQPHEVIACDSVSVNLTKLIGAALTMNAGRTVVLSEPGNFPTDLYMVQGLQARGMAEQRLVARDKMIEALDPKNGGRDVALLMLTHVHYKTGEMFDMAALTKAAHDAGALVLWDLSHSGGAVPVDLNAAGADFAVGCGYKYLNGGPGAPAYAFVAERHHETFRQPITGWMGHAQPFAFSDTYEPAPGVSRMLAGTPPILAMAALECGVELMAEIGMDRLVAKSRALSEFFGAAMAQHCPHMRCVSPADPAQRGSQLSFRHAEAYAICQALIARGVIGDFRDPDILRFGFAPAYVSFADAAGAVTALAEILDSGEWDAPEFRQRAAVT
ncbi:kynureninase [Pontixanthobacter gangjinensis]|uniref:Kynureninase n=1 Tax=Pontixanthobacter gangjinensis TaxID=1028742 RepID=A0A6I4SL09_9SPHN|nr:kynureninase [Pontixanthobacter gangjinensis]MXO55482.1 kynureninase [Pontixanthobacter gangjinensis]